MVIQNRLQWRKYQDNKDMKPYVIASPQYDHVSGGIKVMYGLYGHLLARGYEVYLNQYPHNNVIAIYPEIMHGNPVNASSVVRYILNRPGVMTNGTSAGPVEFDKNDKLYYFSRLFGETDADHYMFLPVINLEQFKYCGGKRDKSAVFVGKGTDLGLHDPKAIVIDRSMARNQDWLASTLNQCSVLYSYDPVSAMSEVARLCGCRVVLLNNTYTKEDYVTKYEAGANGISFGSDTGEKLDIRAFRKHYQKLFTQFDKQLDKFLKETQR